MLSFIKLLHDSELERKKLRTKVLSLTDSEQALRKSEHFSEQLELELAVLKNQVCYDRYYMHRATYPRIQ